jgi:catechol 2,3-dioxygenase-like lactoylglutathione lyase family enzyme
VNHRIVPELYVTDLARSLRFYLDGLGFEIAYERPETRFVAINLAGSLVMLEETTVRSPAPDGEFEAGEWRTADLEFPYGRGVSFQVNVADVVATHARIVDAGYTVKVGLHERAYRVGESAIRLRQFLVMDPDGYLIRPAQPLSSDDVGSSREDR